MRIIGITGKSGVGKTPLIEQIVRKLSERGVSVTYIKHSHHSFCFGPEGKDTSRILLAGARRVFFCGEYLTVDISNRAVSLKDILEKLEDVSVVIIEGFGGENVPSLEVTESLDESRFKGGNIIGFVSRDREHISLPVFSPDDVEGIIEFIFSLPEMI
jgi:molybdopterin-guanine dinucleotide biosynthesis protein MobB